MQYTIQFLLMQYNSYFSKSISNDKRVFISILPYVNKQGLVQDLIKSKCNMMID